MKSLFLIAALLAVSSVALSTINSKLTFYGYPDNDPPSTEIAYTCNGRTAAGGTGTYDDPVSVAVAPSAIKPCTMLYIPYLQKYAIADDLCGQCVKDYANGEYHVDIWTGNASNGGQKQIDCEDNLTPGSKQQVILNPQKGYNVNSNSLFSTSSGCSGKTYPGQKGSLPDNHNTEEDQFFEFMDGLYHW